MQKRQALTRGYIMLNTYLELSECVDQACRKNVYYAYALNVLLSVVFFFASKGPIYEGSN